MAKPDAVEQRLIAVLRKVVGPRVNLSNTGLGLQSMKMLEVVIAVEKEFEITFPEDAPLGKIMASLRNLKQYVKPLLAASDQAAAPAKKSAHRARSAKR